MLHHFSNKHSKRTISIVNNEQIPQWYTIHTYMYKYCNNNNNNMGYPQTQKLSSSFLLLSQFSNIKIHNYVCSYNNPVQQLPTYRMYSTFTMENISYVWYAIFMVFYFLFYYGALIWGLITTLFNKKFCRHSFIRTINAVKWQKFICLGINVYF